MAFFCLQVLSWEAVSTLQLAPSIRKAAHREIRHNSVADCREFGRELAGDNLLLSLFLCVSFPFSILNNSLIVKRDDSLLEISSASLRGGSEKRTTSSASPTPHPVPDPFCSSCLHALPALPPGKQPASFTLTLAL